VGAEAIVRGYTRSLPDNGSWASPDWLYRSPAPGERSATIAIASSIVVRRSHHGDPETAVAGGRYRTKAAT
jgi:hypothetical protein